MTVHSKDRVSWITKLNRIGELSAKDKGIVFNNLGHIIDADMLKSQYQSLERKKAVGIDKVSKAEYGQNLDVNINDLICRLRRNKYKPKPARLVEIPKEDGSKRPLVISCFEDKLVQSAVREILSKIYEPLFLPSSYGYRPEKNCHEALRALKRASYRHPRGAIIEIDIQKYFNSIPHKEMMRLLRKKISDKRFLRLIEILMTAPIGEEANTQGSPQGSIISPVLSNIYLHHAIDEWFEYIRQSHLQGKAEQIRYADDMVFAFESQSDAERVYRALPKRLEKAGLKMHTAKSQIIPAGKEVASKAHQEGKRIPPFNFLGFTCYWGKARKGFWRLKYKSRKDRFRAKLKGMRQYLRRNLNARHTETVCIRIRQVMEGWINYHAISDNDSKVTQFIREAKRNLYWWFNRRGGKRRISWTKIEVTLQRMGIPTKWRTVSMF